MPRMTLADIAKKIDAVDDKRHKQNNHYQGLVGKLSDKINDVDKRALTNENKIEALAANQASMLKVVEANTEAMTGLSIAFDKLSTRINAVIWVVIGIGSVITFLSTNIKNIIEACHWLKWCL